MDISETDASPSPFCASRDISICLNTTNHEPCIPRIINKVRQIDKIESKNIIMTYHHQHQNQNNSPSSPNGNSNSMSTSDVTYQDACSSPDQLIDDAMNSNERLDIQDYCHDNNLERLGKKVSEFITENGLSMQTTLTTAINTTTSNNTTTINQQDNGNDSIINTELIYTSIVKPRTLLTVNENVISVENNKNQTAIKNTIGTTIKKCDINNENNDSPEDFYDDSWSDEEGEDPDYNYSLRRRR